MTSRAPQSIAAATQDGVAEAANAIVKRGNAIDAVCAGVAMAAALDAGVLFGPLHILVAGPGLGLRCIDGRLHQPGRGAPRPRGFLADEEVPRTARVAVPALPAALATALSMFGSLSAKETFDPALAALERKHPRRALLSALAIGGPSVLAREPFSDAIVSAAGRMVQGSITVEDLREVRAPALECDTSLDAVALAPFARDTIPSRSCHAVCAADHRGGIAVACYEIARANVDGFPIDSLGVVAPLAADPVMRGQRRTDPGAALTCASGILLAHVVTRSSAGALIFDDRWDIAAGLGDPRELRSLIDALEKKSLDASLSERAPSCGVLRSKRAPRAYSFTP